MWPTGSIVRVKILGVLGLIDAGETDWKVIGISVEDPLAPLLNDVDDLEVHVPGLVEALHRWLQLYKSPVINTFAFDGKAQGREYATELVRETHGAWQRLMSEAEGGKADGGVGGGLKVVSAGMTRSTSNTRLAALLGANN
jgi:inorganic pyrophosphatase